MILNVQGPGRLPVKFGAYGSCVVGPWPEIPSKGMQDQHALGFSRGCAGYSGKAQCRADTDGDEPQLPAPASRHQMRQSAVSLYCSGARVGGAGSAVNAGHADLPKWRQHLPATAAAVPLVSPALLPGSGPCEAASAAIAPAPGHRSEATAISQANRTPLRRGDRPVSRASLPSKRAGKLARALAGGDGDAVDPY